jgi:hypothetical protein
MNLIQMILGVSGYRHASSFIKRCQNPRETQEMLLRRCLEINAGTAYGKDHGFSSIRTIEDFRKAVPVNSYSDLEPYILRAAQGEAKQLTMDAPILFSTTSGTTGTPKYIPITATSRRDKSTAMRLWLYHASEDHPNLLDGNILGMVSPEVEGYTESGIPYGAESGHVYRNMPRIMRALYAIPYEVFDLDNYYAKYYCILRIAAARSISVIATANPSTILLLARKLQEMEEPIIRDIRDGTFDASLEIPAEVRQMLEDQVDPDPQRAEFLERCLQENGHLLPKDIWPNLALIGCWKGGSVGLYLREFEGLFSPETPIRDFGYLASEVRGSIPLEDEGCAGVVTLETNFFEFVPEEEQGTDNPTFLTADQLEDGRRYFVYPTTTGGLYRYDMNDLVRVNGFFERTPLIEFVQKGKGVSSLTGEKLYEAQVCASVAQSAGTFPQHFEFIVASPEWGDPPRYIFLVEESSDKIPDSAWRDWLHSVDTHLKEQNEEYDVKRKSLRLANPAVKVVEKGEFLKYREKRVAEGAPDGQFKMLKLNPDLEFPQQFRIERVVELNSASG